MTASVARLVAPAAPSRGIAGSAAILVVAVLTVYFNSLGGAFVFDDAAAIVDNPTIRRLGAFGDVLSPPREAGQTVGGRPLVNLTLALNHAVGGTEPRGYHLFNVTVHALAALTLFGLVRRTLRLEPSAKAHTNLGLALQELGRTSEALALDPGFAPARELLDAQRALPPAR